ncbi:MAG: hypothetical protein KDJ90_02085, partial [Nitratireductor sp.]|nr:hypothetical protein [Nitratireductor sp.]
MCAFLHKTISKLSIFADQLSRHGLFRPEHRSGTMSVTLIATMVAENPELIAKYRAAAGDALA